MSRGLELRRVTCRMGGETILNRQSLVVPKGQTIVVTGVNGAGKSTLLYACAGLIPTQRGRVLLAGHPVDPDRPSELMRRGVRRGFVFQHGGLIANHSALANVTLALRYHADLLELSERQIDQRARAALHTMDIEEHDFGEIPGRLSFGQRRRVAFARAMAIRPNFAFFDDPDAGLDGEHTAFVHDMLVRYRDDPEITLVVATNHRVLIDLLASPLHELTDGHLLLQDRATSPPPRSIV